MNVLIIAGHPTPAHSVANATILERLKARFPEAHVRQLGELYASTAIDVETEQKELLWADVIVWLFPIHWYGMPALLKKWLDEVFLYGFAYGTGAKLAGKKLLISATTAAPEELYRPDAVVGHTLEQLLAPLKATARFSGLELLSIVGGQGYSIVLDPADKEAIAANVSRAEQQAERVIEQLASLA